MQDKILVVRFSSLGDIILSLPVYKNLKTFLPDSFVATAIKEKYAPILQGNPYMDLILTLREGESILSFLKKVKKEKFTVLIDLHNNLRSNLISIFSGIPKKIRCRKAVWERRLFVSKRIYDPELKRHTLDRYLDTLKELGIVPQHFPPELPLEVLGADTSQPKFFVPQLSSKNFSELLSSIPQATPLIGINPGSVWKTKQWLPERFAETADALIEETNCKILLFGSEKDSEAVNSVAQSMKHPPINLCGRTDLKTLTWLISKCSLFITNDSGPMHLACAVDVPVVAIFGPTTRELGFFPFGRRCRVVELDLPCRPCSLHGGDKCPLTHFRCMKDLTAEMVLQPCREFLSSRPLRVGYPSLYSSSYPPLQKGEEGGLE